MRSKDKKVSEEIRPSSSERDAVLFLILRKHLREFLGYLGKLQNHKFHHDFFLALPACSSQVWELEIHKTQRWRRKKTHRKNKMSVPELETWYFFFSNSLVKGQWWLIVPFFRPYFWGVNVALGGVPLDCQWQHGCAFRWFKHCRAAAASLTTKAYRFCFFCWLGGGEQNTASVNENEKKANMSVQRSPKMVFWIF